MSRSKRHRLGGFAYLWVLFLVAFLGVGLTIGTEIYVTSVQRDKEKELLAIGRQFRVAIGRYYESQAGVGQVGAGQVGMGQVGAGQAGRKRDYPASLDDLLQDNRVPNVKRHLRKIFVDPMTGKTEWGLVMVGGRVVGVHSLSNKKPIKQDRFEADDMGFRDKEHYSDWVFTYPSDLLTLNDGGTGNLPPSKMHDSTILQSGPLTHDISSKP